MMSSVPPAVAIYRNSNEHNPDYDAAPRKRPCSPSVPSVATMDNASLADMVGESDYDTAPWKQTSSPSVLSLAAVDSSTSLAGMDGEPDCDAAPWKRPSSLNVPSLATVTSSSSLAGMESPYSMETKESNGHTILGKAESFEHMMDELEKEDHSCDVWAWLKDI